MLIIYASSISITLAPFKTGTLSTVYAAYNTTSININRELWLQDILNLLRGTKNLFIVGILNINKTC